MRSGQLLTGLALFTLFFSGGTLADSTDESDTVEVDRSVYVMGTIARADTDITRGAVQRGLSSLGSSATSFSVDSERTAWELGFGYHINESLSFEVSYLDLGDIELAFMGNVDDAELKNVQPETGAGWKLSGIYQRPINPEFGYRLQAGVFRWHNDYTSVQSGVEVSGPSESGTDVLLGVGISFRMSERWTLTSDFQRINFSREPTHMLGVTLQRHFGR